MNLALTSPCTLPRAQRLSVSGHTPTALALMSLAHKASRYGQDELLNPDGSPPLMMATILRERGVTGVHTHLHQAQQYLEQCGVQPYLVTPFSWGRLLSTPVFGARLGLVRCSKAASVAWYRHGHQLFLYAALRQQLEKIGTCVIYAQEPVSARAALQARRSPDQRVIMAVHLRISQADEWADKGQLRRGGRLYAAIRQFEREVIPSLDGLVYVSEWARKALLEWLPEAGNVRSAVISNFIAPLEMQPCPGHLGDLVTTGSLEPVKNHRFLLEVLAEAKQAGRVLTLDIFGEGPLRRDLANLARSLDLVEQVRFRGFCADVRQQLPGYRAYVHASYSESSSLAIIEAMAAGLPIVAADVGPIAELCRNGLESRFWSLSNPREAAARLLALLDCEPARDRAARAAAERFRCEFDASVVGPRLRSFLLGA